MPKRYIPNDAWSRKAAAEGYRARSVYKLQELDEKFSLLKSGQIVLDLGAAPGSWLQYASKKAGQSGNIIGIDLTTIEPVADNVHTYVQDISDQDGLNTILANEGVSKVDLVLSDMAPLTSGVKDVDQWRSIELAELAIATAETVLKPKGACVVKVFRGADFDEFLRNVKARWKDVKIVNVKASRDRSREVYLVLKKSF